MSLSQIGLANAAGTPDIEILAGYNLVVDSNVESPSTYAPAVATVGARFCNTTGSTLNDVQGFIGDYTGSPGTSTPGIYPPRDSTLAGFIAEHPHLANTGNYAFTHVGGRAGLSDASRYIGTLEPGECKVQYWHFKYPQVSNDGAGNPQEPPDGVGVWGLTRDPNDDLWLTFDVWFTSAEGTNGDASWTMTMRNEISAMANKIEPHGGRWFNTNTSTVFPGDLITSNGVLYDLGNINKGFDNDGDGDYDYNAWLQPIGDPSFDPSCFRLIRTSGLFTVSRSSGQPDLVIPFTDQLYFTDLPPDNTGAVGNVYYTFLALDGPCNTALTPYQEVASGADNEKFNADFGAGIPPAESHASEVEIDKLGNAVVSLGDIVSYEVPAKNKGTVDAGLPLISGGGGGGGDLPWVPLVLSDSIPGGLVYVSGSATHTFTSTGVIVLFSTDDGVTWTKTEPPAAQVTNIQWWLTDTLRAGHSGSVTFEATVPITYSGSYVENCADGSFGAGATFDQACLITLISGTNRVGDLVWRDDNANGIPDGAEPGIDGVTLYLYMDMNDDDALDDGDLLITSTVTSGGGAYLFDNLPNGEFLVQVEPSTPPIPSGYSATTGRLYAVSLSGADFLDADFGFGPALSVDKNLISSSALEGNAFQYTISVENLRPGNGTGLPGACTYEVWADAEDPDHGGASWGDWFNPGLAYGAGGPDGSYAYSTLNNNNDGIAGTIFNIGGASGNVTTVEVLLPINVASTLRTDDELTVNVYYNNVVTATQVYTGGFLNSFGQGELTFDITGAGPWVVSDFMSNTLDIELITDKGTGGGSPQLELDAMGFRVTTDQSCGGPNDTLNPVPLTDVYDAERMTFVSADPPVAASSTGGSSPYTNTGVITWTNVGPIYAGGTKVITLTFWGLEPPGNNPTTITNTATVTGAKFVTGEPANGGTDTVTTTLEPTAVIGDIVWNDNGDGGGTASDGIQNGGEDSIPNVTVVLRDGGGSPILTTTTSITGYYLFEGLVDGNYTVVVDPNTLPGTGFTQTGDPDGACPGPQCDDESAVTLSGSTDVLDRDFGYTIPNAIFGNVWNDNDGDAVQDSGENGIPSVTVRLYDGTDTLVDTVATDADGNYVFEDVADGSYYVRVITTTLPAGGTWNQTVDPDVNLDSRYTTGGTFSVSGGNVYGSYDFAYTQSGILSLGDMLYVDWNGDGDQDTGEEGIPNVTVSLYEDVDGDGLIDLATDAFIIAASTSITGYYSFDDLPQGQYVVIVDENDGDFPFSPGGYQQTEDYDGTADGRAVVNLIVSVDTADFGYQPVGAGTIGDFVWRDDNRDGYQGAAEPGISDILVTLYEDGNGNDVYDPLVDAVVITATTDALGGYLFEYLPAGDYLVGVDTADTDLPTDGYGNPYVLSTDSNPITVTLSTGQSYLDADFGFATGAVVGDFLWRDDDLDGFLDSDEPGIPNVTVTLHQWTDVDADGIYSSTADLIGPAILTATTSPTLTYLFTGLPAGDYVVVVDMADPDLPTTNLTYDPDPDFDGAVGIDLSPGQIYYGADFGVGGSDTIGDLLWIDLNDNGVYDPGEAGLANVTVSLNDSTNTLVLTDTTDNDGYYLFTGLLPDTYTVTVQTSDIPAGLTPSYDFDGTLDNQTGGIVLNAGDTILTIDFGYVPNLNVTKTSVGENDPLMAGDTVTYTLVISNPSPPLATVYGAAISDTIPANTNYVSGSLVITPTTAGDVSGNPIGNLIYINPVTINGNSSVTVTFLVTVTDPVLNGVDTITNTVLLTSTMGITDTDTVTNPVVGPANIGDFVWDDLDGDGVQDGGEPGIDGVIVYLDLDGDGVRDPGEPFDTTAGGGAYDITDLVAGTYTVTLDSGTIPAGYTGTTPDPLSVTVVAGQDYNDADFGLWNPANIGDFVWDDLDGDGVQDGGEPGIDGVIVYLDLNGDGVRDPGEPFDTTAGGGAYDITDLAAGTYTVTVDSGTIPAGYTGTTPDSLSVTVVAGQDYNDADFGLWRTPVIGLAKRVSNVNDNGDGTYDVQYTLVAENLGDVLLNNVQITDDLSLTFAGAVGFSVIAGPAATAPLNANGSYDGVSDVNLLIGTDTLAVGEVSTITFTVVVTPGANLGPYTNTATIEGTSPGGTTVTDTSENGIDPDPDGDGDPDEPGENDPTPVNFGENPVIGLAKSAGTVANNGNGTYDVPYTLVVENLGNVLLNNVQITDDLSVTFAGATGFAVIAGPAATAPLNANAGYDGVGDVNLLIGTDTLAVSEVATITFTVVVTPGANLGPYTNTATVEGTSPAGTTVTDTSDDGVDPDPDGDSDPGEPGENDPTPVTFPGNPGLEIAKTLLSSSPVLVGEMVQFQIVVTNTGNTALITVPMTDTYDTTYLSYVDATPASDDSVDDGQINWANVGPIPVGSSATITANFSAVAATASTTNNAAASATDSNGDPVPEDSDDDSVGIDEPSLEVRKLVQIARAAPTQVVTYTIAVTNTGDVPLNPVTVTDTLPAGFGYIMGTATPFEPLGVGQTLIWPDVTGGAGLLPGQSVHVSFEATVPPTIGAYSNVGIGEGVYPGGVVTDTGDVPITVVDPAVEVNKGVAPPGVVDGVITFTIAITNVGPSTLDVVPLFDYFTGPVEYVGGTPAADIVDNVNGVLAWNDLTGPAPNGFDRNLAPGEAFVVATAFRITASSNNFTMTNTAVVTNALDVIGNDADDDDDDEIIVNEPTAIELLYLRASGQEGGVLVEWATLIEIDSYGFRLYRSELENFDQADQLVFQNSQGGNNGAEYTYLDKAVEPERRYWYWLVEVDNQDRLARYGPVSAVPGSVDALSHRLYLPLVMRK